MAAGEPPAFGTLDEAAGWYRAWLVDVALPYWATVGFDPQTGGPGRDTQKCCIPGAKIGGGNALHGADGAMAIRL